MCAKLLRTGTLTILIVPHRRTFVSKIGAQASMKANTLINLLPYICYETRSQASCT